MGVWGRSAPGIFKNKGAENAAWALVGGNRSNAGLCGAETVNLNNPLSNPNSNIGAALSFLWHKTMIIFCSSPLGEN